MLVIKQFGPVTYAMGTLQEILAGTGIAAKVRALPNDVAGCTLEMGADGEWVGALGSLSKATADALYASGALVNLATGATYRDTNGTQYTYSAGAGWMLAGDIGPGSPSTPFASTAERTAWATANLSSLRSGASTAWGPGGEWRFVGPGPDKWSPKIKAGIAMVGDSQSAATGSAGWYEYALILTNGALRSRGNFSQYGYSLYQLRPNIIKAIESGAETIWVMGGVNTHPATVAGTDYVQGAINDMKWILDTCIQNGVKVRVFGIPQCYTAGFVGYPEYCNTINACFRALAEVYQATYSYIWEHVARADGTPSPAYSADGVHFNPTANLLAAQKAIAGEPTSRPDGWLPILSSRAAYGLWGDPLNTTVIGGKQGTDWTLIDSGAGIATGVAAASSGFGNQQQLILTGATKTVALCKFMPNAIPGNTILIVGKLVASCQADVNLYIKAQFYDSAWSDVSPLFPNPYIVWRIPAAGLSGIFSFLVTVPVNADVTKSRLVVTGIGTAGTPITVTAGIEQCQAYDMTLMGAQI